MTEAPPALAAAPQFTPEYWQKIPRQTVVCHIARITNLPILEDGVPWVEIVMKENGASFRRPKAEIQQLLTPNLEVHVETLNKELVTGLYVPDCGWAFRMTAEDLAEYTKKLSVAEHQRQRAALEQTALAFAAVITHYLVETVEAEADADAGNLVHLPRPMTIDVLHMAKSVMSAMNQIVSGAQQ